MDTSHGPHCKFFLDKKKRFCRFRPKPNHEYCPEHACIMGVQEDRKRIPCPLNPNHNCYEDDLKNHLKKCNVTKIRQATEKLPYFSKGINKGNKDDLSIDSVSTLGSVKDLTSDKLGAMIEKVNKLYSEVVCEIEKVHLEHPLIKEELVGSGNTEIGLVESFGGQAVLKKEMLQQASLVGQLQIAGLLSNSQCFVELGAGKGKLSHWIQKASQGFTDNSFLLVERSSVRYKVDPGFKHAEKNVNFERIKIDIQDLNLAKVPGMENKKSIVVVGKHLCGGATDLGIRCAVHTLDLPPDGASKHSRNPDDSEQCPGGTDGQRKEKDFDPGENGDTDPPAKFRRLQDENSIGQCGKKLQGLMIALCCHHSCTWDTYVGRDFMRRHSVNEGEFDLLTRLSSWATCARTRIKGKTTNQGKLSQKSDESSSKDQGAVKESTGEGSQIEQQGDEMNKEEHSVQDLIQINMDDNVHLRERLSVSERELIGRKAKRIIDMGRIEYLQANNLDCCLREYISDDITPENIVLLATTNTHKEKLKCNE